MAERVPYPSDLPDDGWELIRPVITAWKGRHPSASGHQGRYAMREIVNAILYQARTGCIATDVLGLLIAVTVAAANVHDNAIGTALLDKVAAHNPTVTKAWVDAGFKNAVAVHGAALGIDVEVVRRDGQARGFAPLPKRWVVEQTFGTLMLHRRLARDYETLPASSASMIRWSMTDVMTRRLTGTATRTWRDPPAAVIQA